MKKPFIEGQDSFLAGERLDTNPFRGYDEAAQEMEWEQGWRIARTIRQFAKQEAWEKKHRHILKIMHREFQEDSRRLKEPTIKFKDFCMGMATAPSARKLVAARLSEQN